MHVDNKMADEKTTLQLMVLENSRTISDQKKQIKSLTSTLEDMKVEALANKFEMLKAEICRLSFVYIRTRQCTCCIYELPVGDIKQFVDKFYMAMTTNKFTVAHMGIDESDSRYMYSRAIDDNSVLAAPVRDLESNEMAQVELGHIVIACAGAYLRAYCADSIREKLVKDGLFNARLL